MRKRVYVESSVISYLTSRPSRDVVQLARQQLTAQWWERNGEWDVFISPTVVYEIERGDAIAAKRRLEVVEKLPSLPVTAETTLLASALVEKSLFPSAALADALHVALAAVHRADYLLTWNQRHLDNLALRDRVADFIRRAGWSPAKVITPERLLEEFG